MAKRFCLLLVAFAPALLGQTAELSGLVKDPGGALVPNASIEMRNQDTGISEQTITNSEGFYLLPSLKPGSYRATIQANGFKTLTRDGILLEVAQRGRLDITLEVGATEEKVTVVGDASPIDTSDAAVSTVVDRQFVDNLPLNGRSFQSLLFLTPGVTLNGGSGVSTGYAPGQFSVNGQRASSNYWMVDGVSANIGTTPWQSQGNGAAGGLGAFNVLGTTNSLVSVDALQEFRVQTSTYAPEYGRTPGGQISIVTRSGANQFHGSLFDYFRNTILDATDWFANANSLPKPGEQQNDFGGTVSGPIVKDKTFFFFSYEGLRLRQPQTLLSTVPDMASRQSASPAAQPYLNAYPLPDPGAADIGPGIAPFNTTFSDPASVDSYSLRIDHNLSSNLNLFGRFNYSPSSLDQRGGFDTANDIWDISTNTKTATAGSTWTISPRIVNEVHFNYSSASGQTSAHMDDFGGGSVAPGSAQFPSGFSYQNAAFSLYPLFGTSMYYIEGFLQHNQQNQYNVVDTLSVQQGPHSLKFGIDFRRLSPLSHGQSLGLVPEFSDIADLLAGNPIVTYRFQHATATFLFHNLSLFAQDTWRLNPRLTLTYGLRWDVDFTPTTENGSPIPAVTGFSLTNLSNLALAPAGTSIYGTRYGSVAPRIGVAYQISQSPDWASVLRGGFGVFYDLASTEVDNVGFDYYPYSIYNLSYGTGFPLPTAVRAQPPIIPPDSTQGVLFSYDPHLQVPYTLQWNIGLEQALGKVQTLKVSYVGSSGQRLLASEQISNPNPNYQNAILVGNAGTSSYNALQVQFQRRLSNGVQALASYAWAHSLDDGSYAAYANGSFANLSANKGSSDFDIRHTFSGALTYNLPELGINGFAKAITHGWSLDNIVQLHTAPPVDIDDGAFTHLSTAYTQLQFRPDIVPGQPVYLYGPQYPGGKALNPYAFTNPPVDPATGFPLRQGNLGRNVLRAFGLSQWDFAVHRDFPVLEALKLQFRAEMFNILNHPNFAPFDTNFNTSNCECPIAVADPYFGQSTQMLNQASTGANAGGGGFNALYQFGGPRSIQMALKLIF
jgi:outer membrane receptor protein involved in Fe transport